MSHGEIETANQLATSATSSLTNLSDVEFEQRLALLKKGADRIARVKKDLMRDGVHYGTIPGTPKPTLLKPGSEILLGLFNLVPSFREEIERGDNVTAPFLRVTVRTSIHLGDEDGPIVGTGIGCASTWEPRYRYRKASRVCPTCGKDAIIKGKAEYGGGWVCFKKKDGCGANFPDDSPAIAQQLTGQVENPDPAELENTVLKMAYKRSQVDGSLRATRSSDIFTQDAEEAPKKKVAEVVAPEPAAVEPVFIEKVETKEIEQPDGSKLEFATIYVGEGAEEKKYGSSKSEVIKAAKAAVDAEVAVIIRSHKGRKGMIADEITPDFGSREDGQPGD